MRFDFDKALTLWKEARQLFGSEMKTVIMPEGFKDVGELAERQPRTREVFKRLVDGAQ